MTPARDRDAGFALVESIAVLALSALVLLTLLIATDLVSRNSVATARSANTIETLATGLAAVRRDIEGARYIRVGMDSEDPMLFSGGAQAVAIAVGDDGTGGGESLVLIEARYEEGRGALVRSSAQLLPGTVGFGSVAFANHALLLSGPWSYRFSYADPRAAAERWRTAWTAVDRLPAAIRLEVLDADGRPAATMVARLQINSGGCADPAHAECGAGQVDEEDDDSTEDDDGADVDL